MQAVEVARPRGAYELFVKMDLRGVGIAVPKGRINIPREPKPKAEDTILVFAEGRQAEEARRAGAQIVGGTELIEGVSLISLVAKWTLISFCRSSPTGCEQALFCARQPLFGPSLLNWADFLVLWA